MTILVAGAASAVGKNTISAGLIRLMRDSGLHPVPFKALSIESLPLESGLEITPSICIQSQAAGIIPSHNLNPIRVIFSPDGETVRHYISGALAERESCLLEMKDQITACLEKAQLQGSVVFEGTGGISDAYGSKVFQPIIEEAVSSIILVADSLNGGAFASIVGTLELMPARWLNRVEAVIVNRLAGLPWEDPLPKWKEYLQARYGIDTVTCFPTIHTLSAMSEDRWPMQSIDKIEQEICYVAETLKVRLGSSFDSILDHKI